MDIYTYRKSTPKWFSFENRTGGKGMGGMANGKAKGAAYQPFEAGEEKLLDIAGSGVIRRIWMTISERDAQTLKNVWIKMQWDNAAEPQVYVPIGDFFCMNTGAMHPFENACFSSPEGKSFNCFIPMPFRSNARITLCNCTGKRISHLFYDVDATMEDIGAEDMLLHAYFRDIAQNELEKDIDLLPATAGQGRFLGTSVAITPNTGWYGDIWWGESEVMIYIDGDGEYPSLAGTGAEDYIGTAWGAGNFTHMTQEYHAGENGEAAFYRFHMVDPIYFAENIHVTLQTIGGGPAETIKRFMADGIPCVPISDDGDTFRAFYRSGREEELSGWINFFRQDAYRVTSYYYKK